MFPLFRTLVLRYLWQRWDRGLLVALSISLGVATLVSAQMLNKCIEIATLDSTVPADVADLYMTNGEIGVPWQIVEEVKQANVAGIQRAQPLVIDRVVLPEIGNRSGILFGTSLDAKADSDVESNKKLKITFQVINPAAVFGRPVALSRRLYEERKTAGRTDSDPVEVKYTNTVLQFNLLAVIDIPKDSPIAPFAESLVAMDVKTAANLIRTPGEDAKSVGRISRLDLFLEPRADLNQVKETLEAKFGTRVKVRTPEENRKSTEEVIGGMKIILNMCSLGSLIVGLFLVYNALSVTVAERRHDIGIMRSLGATRQQIARMFAIEAMTLGFIGSIPGIPLGVWLANFAIDQFGDEFASIFLNGDAQRPSLDRMTALFAVIAGMVTALLAALVPAMQSASDEPADAVRRAPSGTGGAMRWVHRGACLILIIGGVLLIAFRQYLPEQRKGSLFGMTGVLTGLFLAMPILVSWMARLLIPLCRVMLGVEARLAADNLLRSPGRTGVVIGALAAGVSLMFQTAGVGKSNEVPIREWLSQVIQADAYVFWGNLASANSSMTPMDGKVADDIRKIDGVDRVVGLRFYRPEYRGTFIMVIGIDAADYRRALRQRMPTGLPKLEKFEELPHGQFCVVSENFAEKWKVKEGDTITVPGPQGNLDFVIKGIGQDYSWSQGSIFVDRTVFSKVFEDRLVDAYHVFFKLDQDREATFARVQRYTEDNRLLIQTQASVQLYLAGVIDRLFRVAYLQQVVVGVVAALGVITALLISVLQRRRELGLLRAVGATQYQVIKSVIAEAMLMGFIGTVLGFAMGLPMEWFLLNVVLLEESGFRFAMLIPWKESLGIGLAAIVTSTIAGLIPALHAVRLNITEAIAYE